jgi:hypothetical protein
MGWDLFCKILAHFLLFALDHCMQQAHGSVVGRIFSSIHSSIPPIFSILSNEYREKV